MRIMMIARDDDDGPRVPMTTMTIADAIEGAASKVVYLCLRTLDVRSVVRLSDTVLIASSLTVAIRHHTLNSRAH